MRQFHKPMRQPNNVFEEFDGSGDPTDESGTVHGTATVPIHLAGDKAASVVRTRLVEYIAIEDIGDLLELWSRAVVVSLPGLLWRLRQTERKLLEGPVAEKARSILAGEHEGNFGDLCTRAAIVGRQLRPH